MKPTESSKMVSPSLHFDSLYICGHSEACFSGWSLGQVARCFFVFVFVFSTGRLGVGFSLLSILCPRGINLPRTVIPLFPAYRAPKHNPAWPSEPGAQEASTVWVLHDGQLRQSYGRQGAPTNALGWREISKIMPGSAIVSRVERVPQGLHPWRESQQSPAVLVGALRKANESLSLMVWHSSKCYCFWAGFWGEWIWAWTR